MSPAVSQRLLETKQVGPVTVVTFTHSLMLDEEEIDCIGDYLRALLEGPDSCRLVLNFAAVNLVATHLFGEMIVLHKRVLAAGGRLALCELNSGLRETLEVTSLTRIFNVHGTEDEAVRSLASAN
jgi:anti-anti-sigma factor